MAILLIFEKLSDQKIKFFHIIYTLVSIDRGLDEEGYSKKYGKLETSLAPMSVKDQ